MVFIWRGFGIVVPIVLFISCWITSYWFKDTKLLNAVFIGWSMLWAGITLILFALASFGEKLDENGQPTGKRALNDFFWIPVWVWSLAFIVGSLFLINKEDSSGNYSSSGNTDLDQTVESDPPIIEEVVAEKAKRNLYLYNCAADSMAIEITDTYGDTDLRYDFYVQDNDYEFVTVLPDRYTVKMGDYTQKINLKESKKRTDRDYDGAWLVLCAEVDLVVVDVTDICKENVSVEELAGINWEDQVLERYNGDELIEPNIKSKLGGEVKVVAPNFYIPQEREKRQRIYSLVPISRSDEISQEILLKKLTTIAIR